MDRKNKTSSEKIAKSSARYYQKKDEILRTNCLKNVVRTGNLPLESTMDKYNITWQEIADQLHTHIRENSISQLLEPIPAESRVLKKYKRLFPKSGKTDDLSYLYNSYINTHACDLCGECFTNERRRVCNLDNDGFFTKILCSECLDAQGNNSQAEVFLEKLQDEEKILA